MQPKTSSIPWTAVTFVLLAIATVGYFTQPTLSGALVYRNYGYGGGDYGGSYGGGDLLGYGGLSITQFYEQYHVYIDAVIFLLIFLSLGKALFTAHFRGGAKALYVGVGLALTLGLMLWEERMNISIIYELGPFGVLVLLLVLFLGTYLGILRAAQGLPLLGRHLLAVLGVLAVLWVFSLTFPDVAGSLKDFLGPNILDPIAGGFGMTRQNIFWPIIVLAIILLFGGGGILRHFFGGAAPRRRRP